MVFYSTVILYNKTKYHYHKQIHNHLNTLKLKLGCILSIKAYTFLQASVFQRVDTIFLMIFFVVLLYIDDKKQQRIIDWWCSCTLLKTTMFFDLIIGSLHEIFIIFVLYNNARNTTRNNISKKRKFHFNFYRKTEITF